MSKIAPPIRKDRKPLWDMVPLKQPLRVNLDPCDACNFRCDFCFQNKTNAFKGCVMKDETFERALSQLKEFDEPINVIHMFALGEPLLNKNLPGYIKRIREENVAKEVKITSNGSLLTHQLIDELMEAGLDEFIISLNGLSDEDFERVVNTKVDFSKMLDNMQYLYEHRGNCHVHYKIIGDYFSKDAQDFFINTVGRFADTVNIDGVTNHWSGLESSEEAKQQYAVGGEDYTEWPICSMCFYELAIHSDGSVSPCAADWQKDKQNLGNIFDSTLKEIWDSDFRRDIQVSFLEGRDNPYVACRECEYPCSGAGVNLEPHKEEMLKKYVRV